ncbi:MAG: Hpt domain-containing protein [Acidobacteria bacterium]|nr:MAG: Hpt domain-containing protein [Acidobacteriota bacterium]
MSMMSDTVPEVFETPVLDTSAGLLSTGGDPELLNELVLLFIQMVPAQLATMKEAVATSDSTSMRREAHSLKGAAGALGAVKIRKLAEDIEVLADQGDVETAQPLVETIERLITQLKQENTAD